MTVNNTECGCVHVAFELVKNVTEMRSKSVQVQGKLRFYKKPL